MLARTATAFRQGAKVAVWQEQSALVLPQDRQSAISRAEVLARSHGAYLEIWLGVLTRTPSLPYFLNQAILISPAGHVVWTYEKTYPVIGTDAAFTVSGRGVLPMADTPYGRADHRHLQRRHLPRTAAPSRAKRGRHPAGANP